MKKRKIAALVVAAIYIFLSITQNWLLIQNMLVFLVFPLGIIFFSERLADYIGPVTLGARISKIDKPSQPEMVEFAGWVILLLPIIIFILTAQMS